MTIFISNLPVNVSETQLIQLVERFGDIQEIRIPINSLNGIPKGYAYVQLSSEQEVNDAINALNHYIFEGMVLYVERTSSLSRIA